METIKSDTLNADASPGFSELSKLIDGIQADALKGGNGSVFSKLNELIDGIRTDVPDEPQDSIKTGMFSEAQKSLKNEIYKFNRFCHLIEERKAIGLELSELTGGNASFEERKKEQLEQKIRNKDAEIAQYGLLPSPEQISIKRSELASRQKALFGMGGDPIYRGDSQCCANLAAGELEAVSGYALLLRAKLKLRNRFGAKARSKTTAGEAQVREDFRKAIEGRLSGAENSFAAQTSELGELFSALSEKIGKQKATLARGITGIVMIASGFIAGAAGFITTGAVLGAIGRFAAVDGLWNTIHLSISGRKSNGANAVAAHVFYGSQKKLSDFDRAKGMFHRVEGSVENKAREFDEAFVSFAGTMAWGNFLKKPVAFLCAALPFAGPLFESKPAALAIAAAKQQPCAVHAQQQAKQGPSIIHYADKPLPLFLKPRANEVAMQQRVRRKISL